MAAANWFHTPDYQLFFFQTEGGSPFAYRLVPEPLLPHRRSCAPRGRDLDPGLDVVEEPRQRECRWYSFAQDQISTMANKTKWSAYTRARVDALRTAAAADDREALVELAVLYDDGSARDSDGELLVKRDRRRARTFYARAAELGDASAMTAMADNLTPTGHSTQALARAEKLYRRAFRLGEDTAAENLAATYKNLGRYRDAVRWYRRAATAGSPTAPLELARAELYGTGTRRDARAAFVTLRRLARQRLGWNNWLRVEAMQLMADALMNGWLVRRDHAQGEAWLRRAAKLDPEDYYAAR